MNKQLILFSAGLLAAASLYAAEPRTFMNNYAMGISSNGRWLVSDAGARVTVIDLETNRSYTCTAEHSFAGSGSNISANGIMVGSYTAKAMIFKDGVFREFDSANLSKYSLSLAMAITPDGSRVVGEVSNPMGSGVNLVPVYWELNPDGSASEMHFLPYPDKDFSGRTPLYVTAIGISADGSTIVGQVLDYSGTLPQPILYTRNSKGAWDYTLPLSSLINPSKLAFPELNVPVPTKPDPTNYMSAQDAADYNEALNRYLNGGQKPEDLPNLADYMTAAQANAYDAAVREYNKAVDEYNANRSEFYNVFAQVMAESAKMIFNSVFISPDGKTIATGAEMPGETEDDDAIGYVIAADWNSGAREITNYTSVPRLEPTQVLNGGIILGANGGGMGDFPPEAFIKLPENDDFISLYDYVQTVSPAAATWMMDNLYKSCALTDWDTMLTYYEDIMCSGAPYTTPDLKTFYCGVVSDFWDDDPSQSGEFAYLMKLDETGINDVAADADKLTVEALAGGILRIGGMAETVEVYDLSGRLLFSAPAAATVATSLANGTYIVKVSARTTSTVVKVNF